MSKLYKFYKNIYKKSNPQIRDKFVKIQEKHKSKRKRMITLTKEYNCAKSTLKIKLMTLGENIFSAFNQPIISIQNTVFTNQRKYNPIK